MKAMKPLIIALSLTGIVTLNGCSTVGTAIEKRNLSVQSKMSNSVFLEPVSNDKKTVYIQIRNSSDQSIDTQAMNQQLAKTLQSKGYRAVNDPAQANYVLQQNILSVKETNKDDAYNSMDAGFGGATAGVLMAGSTGNNYAGGALLGAVAGIAADALVKDVYFNLVSDIQIKEKAKGKVNYTTQANAGSGTSMNTRQTISGQSDYLTHTTRIVAVANQVNLAFDEAKPMLEDKLVKSVAGIF